jgi:predicted transposase YbfD/YdcC
LAEQGITLTQRAVEGKSNEIPAMRELLALLDIRAA